ncbi:MAG TPA: hypothetical protein PL090_08605 [Syntrophales bacterium]|nr:hypothetical protein [Syntrophales bacterium]HPQ60337.1 hypothetical protein [Syntrophales bacterium]
MYKHRHIAVILSLLITGLLLFPAAGEGKAEGEFSLRVFHTGNVAGKVSPCST